jgi:hypothetical protein
MTVEKPVAAVVLLIQPPVAIHPEILGQLGGVFRPGERIGQRQGKKVKPDVYRVAIDFMD